MVRVCRFTQLKPLTVRLQRYHDVRCVTDKPEQVLLPRRRIGDVAVCDDGVNVPLCQRAQCPHDAVNAVLAFVRFHLLVVVCVEQPQHDDKPAVRSLQKTGKLRYERGFRLKGGEGAGDVCPAQ